MRQVLRAPESSCASGKGSASGPNIKDSRLTYYNSCTASKRWRRSANDLILPATHGRGGAFDGRFSGGDHNIAGDEEHATAASHLLPLAHSGRHGVGAFADVLRRGPGPQTQVSLWAVSNKACVNKPLTP